MADETIAVLEYLGRPVHLIGHSDGGDVGLLVTLRRPDLVERLVMIGSNFHHSGLLPIGELKDTPRCLWDVRDDVRRVFTRRTGALR